MAARWSPEELPESPASNTDAQASAAEPPTELVDRSAARPDPGASTDPGPPPASSTDLADVGDQGADPDLSGPEGWGPPAPETQQPWLSEAVTATATIAEPTTIERLRDGRLNNPVAGWITTVVITAIAFAIRFVDLGFPTNKLVFDETYYAKDAWTLWKFGYEKSWPKGADQKILTGDVNVFTDAAEFVVHPPLGKWLIGVGEQWFGMNSFGWRFASCVFGALLVAATIRLARRLSRSTLIGGIAGVLLTFDGLSFVMSRMALLDIFQAVFLVAAVTCCLADRDYFRGRLAAWLERRGAVDLAGSFGPIVWLRPWRLAAGVLFGLALATKWNSMFVLAAFGLLSVLWDVGARRLAGADFRAWLAVLVDGIPAFIRLVLVAAVVYVASWTSWLTTTGGYDRDWASKNPDHPWVKALGDAFASLLWLHKEIYEFHIGDYIRNATHPYDAHPAGWLLMARPIGMDAVNDIKPGTDGCLGPENCIRVISGMGTPILWWLAAIALVVSIVWWLGGRDWRFGVPVIAAMSTYVPWWFSADRPVFFFYAITIVPFTVTGLAMVMGLVLGDADSPRRRRGAMIVGVAIALVVANFAWIYPVLTDQLMPYSQWLARMWLRTWI